MKRVSYKQSHSQNYGVALYTIIHIIHINLCHILIEFYHGYLRNEYVVDSHTYSLIN